MNDEFKSLPQYNFKDYPVISEIVKDVYLKVFVESNTYASTNLWNYYIVEDTLDAPVKKYKFNELLRRINNEYDLGDTHHQIIYNLDRLSRSDYVEMVLNTFLNYRKPPRIDSKDWKGEDKQVVWYLYDNPTIRTVKNNDNILSIILNVAINPYVLEVDKMRINEQYVTDNYYVIGQLLFFFFCDKLTGDDFPDTYEKYIKYSELIKLVLV